jgi:ADP-ribose pyrophosphatase YjhB (NUDIX family)
LSEWIRWLRSQIGSELIFVNSAGGWVEDDDGRVLLQRRARDGDVWGFPGGVMELGEAAHETAVRELREETGLEVEPVSLIGIYTKYFETLANGDQCQCVAFMFKMRVVGGTLTVDNNETFELRFFNREAMPHLYSEQHRQIAQDALRGSGPYFR